MLIAFFYDKGMVYSEFVPPGQVVNCVFYVNVFKRLKQKINWVKKEIKDSWKLHHDNGDATVPQPPYSPGLAPPDFFLFPKVNKALKGRHLYTIDNIKTTYERLLKAIPVEEFSGAKQSIGILLEEMYWRRRGRLWRVLG